MLVLKRLCARTIERGHERPLQTWCDALNANVCRSQQPSPSLIECAVSKAPFQPFAHCIEVDPEAREGPRVDPRRTDLGQDRGNVSGCHSELAEDARSVALIIPSDRKQNVFCSDVG